MQLSDTKKRGVHSNTQRAGKNTYGDTDSQTQKLRDRQTDQ